MDAFFDGSPAFIGSVSKEFKADPLSPAFSG